jgi:response regulator of citrate/malate metabolism
LHPVGNINDKIFGKRILLASVCRALQKMMGDKPFFLSTRKAGQLLNMSHEQACRYLAVLEQDGWIQTVKKGTINGRKATEYRYTGDNKESEKS